MKSYILKPLLGALKPWYVPLLVGLFFVGVGITTFISPDDSYVELTLLFSIGFIFSGVSKIIFSIAIKEQLDNWGWYFVLGLLTLVTGFLLLVNLELSIRDLAPYVSFIILIRSIATLNFAIDFKKYGSTKWGILLALGLLGTLFSFILLWNPNFAGMTIVFWIGLTFLWSGTFSFLFSLFQRKLYNHSVKISTELKERYRAFEINLRQESF